MNYRCWTVKCKNEDCAVILTLDTIGPEDKFKHALLPPLLPFTVTCSECHSEYSYSASDVEERNIENPSLTYHCAAFLEAISKATSLHTGTAGFNDGDGRVVAGVFWHNGGYILDRDGRQRDIDPDDPGWYWWSEEIGGSRYLHGPFDTEIDAEFNLEVHMT